MRALNVDETELDLAEQTIPFMPNNTVVAMNASAASVTLQSSDESGGTFATLATIEAGESAEVTLEQQFIKLAAAGALVLLGN